MMAQNNAGKTSLDVNEAIRDDLAGLLQVLGEGILLFDYEWRIVYANDVGRRISRLEPHHFNGPTHWEIFPASVGTEVETMYRRSMAERVSLEMEFYYPPFETWFALRTIPIPTGLALHYRDITKLKALQLERDKDAQQLKQVFEVTSDGIIIMDRDYTYLFLNRRANEMLSPSGDLLGKNMWEMFPDAAREDSPFRDGYHKAMDERVPARFEAYYPAPQNQWFHVEIWPAEGGVIVFFRDITEDRKAAEELRSKNAQTERQAAELETMYRGAPIGLALFDTEEFRYLRLNDRQAAFFGLKPEDVVGKTLTEMAPIPGLRELFEQVRAGGAIVNYPLEGELANAPGEHRHWTVNYTPVHAADGSVQAIAAASLEVTHQKRAEKALIDSEKLAAVGRLASSISHEINNPLESIMNLLYLVESHDGLPEELRTYVELMQSELGRVSQIATQTLRFHRQDSQPERRTAQQLVEPVLNLYKGRLVNSGIVVDANFDSRSAVLCLENEIRQVLNNLFANAIDAMRGGGCLKVRAIEALDPVTGANGVTIVVSDDGHGMSKATLARVFEPFFTTKEVNGTGLGLWISAEIVRRHQGRLEVESKETGKLRGTTFRLFLPMEAQAGIESAGSASS